MKNLPHSINWNRLFAKLTTTAIGWCKGNNVDSETPKDLANGAMLEEIKNFHHLNQSKTEDDIFRLAYTIMWHDILDLKKSHYYTKTDRPDEIEDIVIAINEESFERIVNNSNVKKFYDLANGEQDLIDFIDAILGLDTYKREDIAFLLNITPQEVTNLQRKLKYRYLNAEE